MRIARKRRGCAKDEHEGHCKEDGLCSFETEEGARQAPMRAPLAPNHCIASTEAFRSLL